MANSFVKPEQVINQGLGALQREILLPRLVTSYRSRDFIGQRGDTVKVRIPSVLVGREYEWRTRSGQITVDDLNEQTIDVKLDRHIYNAVTVTDEELTLDISSWGEQVAGPQVRAVAEKLESLIASAMMTGTYKHGPLNPGSFNDFHAMAVEARRLLNIENVPASGRYIVLGSNLEADALNDSLLKKVDESGSGDVLREAVIGRIAGFTVIGNVNSIDPDAGYAFHSTAFGFANLAPAAPVGNERTAAASYEGLAMRWVADYEASYLRNRSVYNSFAGAVSVEDGRINDPDAPGFGDLTGQNVRAVPLGSGAVSS